MISPLVIELKKHRRELTPFALTLYEIITETKPEVVFEIGVRHGYSTRTILAALHENKKGKLYSCDIRNCKCEMPDEFKPYWDFKRISSSDYYKQWNLPIDILLIDGNHHYETAKSDFENYSKFVKKDGYILLHDTISWEGSRKFFQEITYPKINFLWRDGLGIIQKV